MVQYSSHITIRKDESGIITVSACDATNDREGQCPEPIYSDCDECMEASNTYACYCDDDTMPQHIYGSGGCEARGGDCKFKMMSDIWNGLWGDSGYTNCMASVTEIGLTEGQPNLRSECVISVERVVVRGDESGEGVFSDTSASSCSGFAL